MTMQLTIVHDGDFKCDLTLVLVKIHEAIMSGEREGKVWQTWTWKLEEVQK